MVATFVSHIRPSGVFNESMRCRETGDIYVIVDTGSAFRIYVNGCYQAFRLSRSEALEYIEREAAMGL